MKINKYLLLSICLVIVTTVSSCNVIPEKKKPNNMFYTNLASKDLAYDKTYSGKVLEMNLYREVNMSGADIQTIKNFTKNLKKENYISKPNDLPSKPKYRIYLYFSKDIYVINVYNERYISLFPWDGDLDMDYIDMKDVYINYNLYGLCRHIIPEY